MKGKLHKTESGWELRYVTPYEYKTPKVVTVPLHPDDLDSEIIRWANNGSLNDKEVEFEIVKKFMADETLWYAKLTPYISDNFQIGPDGAYEHEEDDRDWDNTLTDGLEDDDMTSSPEELIESHKRYIEMMKYVHEEEWNKLYSKYKGVSDLNDFFDWLKENYYPPARKPK